MPDKIGNNATFTIGEEHSEIDFTKMFPGLDIPDTAATGKDNTVITEEGTITEPPINLSKTALELDQWDIQRGKDCLKQSPKLLGLQGVTQEAVADLHGVAFLMEPKVVEHCADNRRKQFIQQLLETPDCQALRQSTVLNDVASELAANAFGEQYHALLQADAAKDALRKREEQAGKKPNTEKQEMQDEMGLRRAVAAALSSAKEEVDNYDEMCRGLGGDGGADGKMDMKKMAEAFKKIRSNHMLKNVFERAGRFRRFMQSKQRQKTVHGQDDVVGVELGGDIGKLLPNELVQIADEDLELDAIRRLVERQMMCRQYEATEPVGKGPVVVCVDESGSMNGNPIWNAKAFALSMAYMAKMQNRWCCLIGYAGGTEGTICVLQPGKWDQMALLQWLEHFYSGGTTVDVPLVELPGRYWSVINPPKGKTDVVLITDGIVDVPDKVKNDFNAWKLKNEVKCISLIINGQAGELGAVSDQTYTVRGISTEEEGIAKCLSL